MAFTRMSPEEELECFRKLHDDFQKVWGMYQEIPAAMQAFYDLCPPKRTPYPQKYLEPIYRRISNKYPNPEIEKRLSRIKKLKEKIITSNLNLVYGYLSKKYVVNKTKMEDLVQEGCIGLTIAVDRFDHTRGLRFSTYAIWWIRQTINRKLFDPLIHVPNYLIENYLKMSQNSEEQKDPPWKSTEVVSLDTKIGEEGKRSLEEFIPGESDNGETILDHKNLSEQVNEAMSFLTDREKVILKKRFGFDGYTPKTLEEIGMDLGYTRERIRQLEANALKKLKNPVFKRIFSQLANS